MLTFFDIETVPRPEKEIAALMPQELKDDTLPAELETMPPIEYKIGNLKDPLSLPLPESITDKNEEKQMEKRIKAAEAIQKATEAIATARKKQEEKHVAEWQERKDKHLQAASNKRIKWFQDAALHAELGQCRIITTTENQAIHCHIDCATIPKKELNEFNRHIADKFPRCTFVLHTKELTMLEMFWRRTAELIRLAKLDGISRMVGFCIKKFDLPFLWRRSMLLGSPPPREVTTGKPPYLWEKPYVDMQEIWQAGRREDTPSLAHLLRAFDLEPKNGDGGLFYQMWNADPTRAVEYAIQDIQCEYQLGGKMGFRVADHVQAEKEAKGEVIPKESMF